MATLKLGEVVERLEEFDEDQTIYVRGKGSVDSSTETVVDFESDDGDLPATAAGMDYFLEISLARDAIRVWSTWRDGVAPTTEQKVQAIAYYAKNDAFMPAE